MNSLTTEILINFYPTVTFSPILLERFQFDDWVIKPALKSSTVVVD